MKTNITFLLALFTVSITYAQLQATPGMCLEIDNTQWQDARNTTFTVPAGTEFTITAWVKASGDQQEWAGIVSITGSNNKIALISKALSGQTHNRQLGVEFGTDGYTIDTGLVIPDGTWAFVGMTLSGTTLKVFLDDAVYTNNAITSFSVVEDTAATLWVGSNANWSNRIWNGQIEEVAIYSSAIAEATVLANRSYIKTQADIDAATTMLAYYQFNYFMSGGDTYLEDHKNAYDMWVGGTTKPGLMASTAPLSMALGVDDLSLNQISAFPNPVIAGETLNFKNLNEEAQLSLYGVTGQHVFSGKVNSFGEIAVPKISRGMYLYKVYTTTKQDNGKLLVK